MRFKDLLLLVYGMAHGHKPLHTLREHIDTFLIQKNLDENATECRKATVRAKVSLGWGSDVDFPHSYIFVFSFEFSLPR